GDGESFGVMAHAPSPNGVLEHLSLNSNGYEKCVAWSAIHPERVTSMLSFARCSLSLSSCSSRAFRCFAAPSRTMFNNESRYSLLSSDDMRALLLHARP